MNEQEKSEAGDPIYRYEEVTPQEFMPAFGDGDSIDAISEHIEKHVGEVDLVFHELISDKVHVDVHFVKPSAKFPFNVLVTSGMSDLPMTVPEGLEQFKYAELCVLLPADWKIDEASFNDENNYWPVRWLKTIARFPHDYKTWIGHGHTIPNGENADPFAENTKLGCMLLLPSILLGEEFSTLKINDEKVISFYCLMPIYKEEMQLKLKKGTDALLDKFDEFDISEIIDLDRTNTCQKKGPFGLW
jgi:hypothetical protein